MGAIVEYFKGFHQGNTTIPDKKALKELGRVLDASAKRVIIHVTGIITDSNGHRARVALLQGLDRNAGPYGPEKCRFRGITSFEQMAALSGWLGETAIRQKHTLFLATDEDEHIPATVAKYNGVRSNLMHVCLGATSGSHKAPKYEDWAGADPSDDPKQAIFMEPLEALEILRQPGFSAATVLKGDAYDTDCIDEDWRYGSKYACVEDKGQSKAGAPKETRKKLMSAGLNLTALVNECSLASDPLGEETNICPVLNYEDFAGEGYADDTHFDISPGAIIEAAERALVGPNRSTAQLDRLMQNLVFPRLGIPVTPAARAYIAERLLANRPAE